jgi:epoxyqueuosine reductase
MSLSDEIKSKALELGFDLVGITDAGEISSEQVTIFQSWLESGCAGQMAYMRNNFDKRTNPSKLLENAQSVIVVGLNYNPSEMVRCNRNLHGNIASYACYEDYHTFFKKKLRELADYIDAYRVTSHEPRVTMKICVDSVPIAERALAVRTGLGFIGKNHMLINPELGCKIFLGEIITDLKLDYDEPISECRVRCIAPNESTFCSSCDKCKKACPTGALRQDGFFDARKCINYLTIEYKGEIPPEFAEKIGNRLFGCEECINACPYQKNAPGCKNRQFKFYPERAQINLEEVLCLNEELFKNKFHDSVLKRTGLDVLKRNARICIANKTFL